MAAPDQKRKEFMAFMPTSNDALYSSLSNNDQSTFKSSSNTVSSILQQFRTPANGFHLSSSDTSLATPPTMSSADLPRERVASASDIPMWTRLGHDPADEATWYDVYCRVIDVHERERKLWTMERDKLMAEKDRLGEEAARLKAGRNDSAVSGHSRQQQDDKVYFNAETVKKANEKLAEISVVGGSSVDNSRVTTPSGVTVTSKDHSMQGTPSVRRASSVVAPALSSIAEGKFESPPKELKTSVPNITLGGDSTADGYGSEITPAVEKENPYSPPTTAAVMSPHPPNYIMHAGHTPLATQSRSARSSFISDLTQSQELFAQPPLTAQLIQGHGDSDFELKSPKMLPTEPGDINVMLEALESRLQVVSEHPEENKPEALKKAEAMSDEDDDEDDESGTAVTDSPGGIKLKSGRKMNFGAQLGAMG